MAAERYTSDVLQMFYGSISGEESVNLPQPMKPLDYIGSKLARTDFHDSRLAICVENGSAGKLWI